MPETHRRIGSPGLKVAGCCCRNMVLRRTSSIGGVGRRGSRAGRLRGCAAGRQRDGRAGRLGACGCRFIGCGRRVALAVIGMGGGLGAAARCCVMDGGLGRLLEHVLDRCLSRACGWRAGCGKRVSAAGVRVPRPRPAGSCRTRRAAREGCGVWCRPDGDIGRCRFAALRPDLVLHRQRQILDLRHALGSLNRHQGRGRDEGRLHR